MTFTEHNIHIQYHTHMYSSYYSNYVDYVHCVIVSDAGLLVCVLMQTQGGSEENGIQKKKRDDFSFDKIIGEGSYSTVSDSYCMNHMYCTVYMSMFEY